nr:MAG TPA: Type II secretion system, protein M [Caudoviricetes sp.]
MKKSEKFLWVISILSFLGMLILLYFVLTLADMVLSYQHHYYELLEKLSQLNTQIHYPGG